MKEAYYTTTVSVGSTTITPTTRCIICTEAVGDQHEEFDKANGGRDDEKDESNDDDEEADDDINQSNKYKYGTGRRQEVIQRVCKSSIRSTTTGIISG